MKMFALVIALAVIPFATEPASAHDFSHDVHCRIVDRGGEANSWTFTWNDQTPEVAIETGYARSGSGEIVMHDAGERPIWFVRNDRRGFVFVSRDAPEWSIRWSGAAELIHHGVATGFGKCWPGETEADDPHE